MRKILLPRKEVDFSNFIKRPAKESDFSQLISEDVIIYDEKNKDKPLLLYFKFTEDTSELVRALKRIPYETNKRSSGLVSTSRIFGFDPATGIRKQYCSATRLAIQNPMEHKLVVDFGEKIADIYKQYLPDVYTSHEQIAIEKVKKQWRIPLTPFTSGIINKNNFEDVYSNMIVFKGSVSGGYLSLPEFDVGLQCADNTLVMFDGQKMLHGVTPIYYHTKNAYRYSIVYYSLKKLWKCDDLNEEIAKIRNKRAKIERENALNNKKRLRGS